MYGATILSDKLLILIGLASFILVLLSIWYVDENMLFRIDVIISVSLGFVALWITLFFVNREHTRRIKENYFHKQEFIHKLRAMYILLSQVINNLCESPKEKISGSVEVINTSIKEIHLLEYWHLRDQFDAPNIYKHLNAEMEGNISDLLDMDNFFNDYISTNTLSLQTHAWLHSGIQSFQKILDLKEFQLNGKRIGMGDRTYELLGKLVNTKVMDAYENQFESIATRQSSCAIKYPCSNVRQL